jgi:hypothetical protein
MSVKFERFYAAHVVPVVELAKADGTMEPDAEMIDVEVENGDLVIYFSDDSVVRCQPIMRH